MLASARPAGTTRALSSRAAASLALVILVASSCSGTAATFDNRPHIAFLMVGSPDDLGYNAAVVDGSVEVARRFPDVRISRIENVPESEEASSIMQALIDEEGVDLIFATSFGYGPFAYDVAARNPDVVVVHQGGAPEPDPALHNFGTYFGSHWEAMYEAGVAAGHATETGVLGFIAAFPIPATYANVNAFMLGAELVRPDIVTAVTFTADWCDPEIQQRHVTALLGAGADVLAQHQDCTKQILEQAEQAAIAGVVGYHADGSEVAATRWLAGAVWTWGSMYNEIVAAVLDGRFDQSPWTGDYRGSLADGNNPFALTVPGPSVSPATRQQMEQVRDSLAAGDSPFVGPLRDVDGEVRVLPGDQLTVSDIDGLDWFVEGVTVLEVP